jgi:hypothetical protein
MEDDQGSYSHGDEVIGLHVSMGNAETESNGHKQKWSQWSWLKL